jgi:hypothetical protein
LALAFIALLLVALGGTSYAAVKLSANSVQTKHIKNSAVTGTKVKKDTLTGADIKEASLQGIVSSESAHAAKAAGVDKTFIKSAPYAVATAPQVACPGTPPGSCFTPLTQFTSGSVNCDPGQVAVGGGARPDDFNMNTVVESYPAGASGWAATVGNDDVTRPHGFNVYVICIPGSAG